MCIPRMSRNSGGVTNSQTGTEFTNEFSIAEKTSTDRILGKDMKKQSVGIGQKDPFMLLPDLRHDSTSLVWFLTVRRCPY